MKTFNVLIIALFLSVAATKDATADQPLEFSQAELQQMLAPVALYPDTVLSHVLIAATYPLEVVQAHRWAQRNPGLEGEDAVNAVDDRDWDPSVKALVAFPEILRRMNEDLEWTQRLGEAFMLQEAEVVSAVQDLRQRAYAAGNLRSNDHVQVVREREVIYVEPARPNVVYVPYYDPRVVYGPWWWSSYPPVYWAHPPGFHVGVTYHWGRGYRIAPIWFYTSSFHWARRQVVVVHHHHYHGRSRPVFHSSRQVVHYGGSSRWQHNPRHRRGVGYRAPSLSEQYSLPGRYGNIADRIPQQQRRGGQRPSQQHVQRDWAAHRRGNVDFSSNRRPTAQTQTRTRDATNTDRPARIQSVPRQRSTDSGRSPQQRPQAQSAPNTDRPARIQSFRNHQSVDSGRSFQQRPQAQAPRAQAPRVQAPQRPANTQRVAPVPQAAPTPRAQAPRVQAPRAQAPQRATPAPQAAPAQRATPAPRAAPAQRATPRVRANEDDRQQER